MFGSKIKIDKNLLRRIEQCYQRAGYSSAEEFVRHVLEREVGSLEQTEADERVTERLKGLGYIE